MLLKLPLYFLKTAVQRSELYIFLIFDSPINKSPNHYTFIAILDLFLIP